MNRAALSVDEKQSVKQQLLLAMAINPLVRKPALSRRQYQDHQGLIHSIVMSKPMFATLMIAIVLAASGGVSLAAEQTVPGDKLYPVKVGVNEEVRAVLSFSQSSKADWAIQRAERRMEEAEKLAVANRLDNQARAALSVSVGSHIAQAAAIAQVFSGNGDINAATDIQSQIEASLSGHARVLLGLTNNTSTETTIKVTDFVIEFAPGARAAGDARAQAETKLNTQGQPMIRAAAEGKLQAVKSLVTQTEAFIARHETRVDNATLIEVDAALAAAAEDMAAGEAALQAGQYHQAFIHFQSSQRLAQEAKVIMTAAFKLSPNVIIDFSADGQAELDSSAESENTETEASTDATTRSRSHIDVGAIIDRAEKIRIKAQDTNRLNAEMNQDNQAGEVAGDADAKAEAESEDVEVNSNLNVNVNLNIN